MGGSEGGSFLKLLDVFARMMNHQYTQLCNKIETSIHTVFLLFVVPLCNDFFINKEDYSINQ